MIPYAIPLAASGLKIDWTRMPTYNTIMSVAAGAGLLLVVALGRLLLTRRTVTPDGWVLAFGALGFTLVVTGLHMTLTWPLAGQGFPFDNIIFGEPALAFGVFLSAASFYLWKRGHDIADSPDRLAHTARVASPISVFVFGLGLACFGIAAAGWKYTLFAAPPEEPISGEFADMPMLEASFMSGLYVLVGIGALLFPFALLRPRGWIAPVIGVVWTLAGLAFLFFGGLNYFTHIGLIVNTM
ncbi:DUF981 family protein [Streptomyces sp. DT24]|uniref:DUF981 family protein n=1 Tax=unclassified Streptomyces TaxID=2593676 RepID=UPI0023B8EA86|nr:DUF981 family protein [Streptomyces sp. AM 4-1-1]WEH33876.1 DUF981 family protein [Streptomyces sp. AM 4-1-1]